MKKVLFNAKVYVDKGVYQEAVLIEDDLIQAVGTSDEILAMADDSCEMLDCQGRTMIPGLNDSHQHLLLIGLGMREVKTDDITSIDMLIERCRTFIAENPAKAAKGIHSIGWNQDMFTDEQRMPTRHDLDKISTEIPIVLERICGHALTTNTKALEILGITKDSPEIPGGEFRLDENGEPNGIFTENGCFFANNAIPPVTEEECAEAIIEAMEYAVAHGLTTVQSNDVGSPWCNRIDTFKLFRDIYAEDKALLRYHHQMCFDTPADFQAFVDGEEPKLDCYKGRSWLTLGPLKLFKDGSLGARTALKTTGYVGDEDNHGIDWTATDLMDEYCQIAKKAGMQVVTHSIGDEASKQTIDCYERAFVDGENKLRHSLVHCQLSDEALLTRIVDKGILVQAQPIFVNSDLGILEPLVGPEMAATSYNFGTLLKNGAKISYGTDAPVEDCNPFPNLYLAVTRTGLDGKPEGGFFPKECVDIESAVDAYTLASAYNEFREDVKGRIKPGCYADLVVLDRDIFTVDPVEIKDILPVMTMVGGKIVYGGL